MKTVVPLTNEGSRRNTIVAGGKHRKRSIENNIEPYQYLIALFKGLPHAHTADDYEILLPWRLNPLAA